MDVVRATAKRARIQNEIERLINEPLPIVYERIAAQYPADEHRGRAELANQMQALEPNQIHEQLMALNWPTVLTTNYDNCLELASGNKFATANLASESTYSVFRRKRSNGGSLWHIHGELSGPRTMMLGLHEYSGYLQKIRQYFTTKVMGSPFVYGAGRENIEDVRHSWGDLFLRDNVHIVGFGFGYAEIVLWWLLAYKQRLRFWKGLACGQTTVYQMGNIAKGDKGRLELMQGLGAKIRYISSDSGRPTRKTWDKVIEMLKRERRN